MNPKKRKQIIEASKQADWQQVVINGGPPCFHVEGGKFCMRAQRWDGHKHSFFNKKTQPPIHEFVSLAERLEGCFGPQPTQES